MVAAEGGYATCARCGLRFPPDAEQRARLGQAERNGWTIRLYCRAHTPTGGKNWEIILPGPG
jgi:hypothetical protein